MSSTKHLTGRKTFTVPALAEIVAFLFGFGLVFFVGLGVLATVFYALSGTFGALASFVVGRVFLVFVLILTIWVFLKWRVFSAFMVGLAVGGIVVYAIQVGGGIL